LVIGYRENGVEKVCFPPVLYPGVKNKDMKKFMNYLIKEAKKMRKKGLRLTVYKDNERAYSLYKKLGFKEERIVVYMRLNFEEEK